MEDKSSGERKKLSLSSGGKLTLKNPIPSSKLPSSVTTNARSGRSTVQVEVKRTKRPVNRTSLNDISTQISNSETRSGLSAKEIHSRSKMLQEGLAKTAAEAETIAIEKIEKTKIEEFKYYNYQEKYRFLIFLAGGLLLLEFVLKNTLFRSFI